MGLKYRVNEQFFDTWTEEMAYVLGYIYADGHLIRAPEMRGHYVCITSTDYDRLALFKKLLQAEHKITKRNRGGNYKEIYLLRIGSKRLYQKLCGFGLTPHKSLILRLPVIPKAYFGAFVRGYFDGDGCAFIERSKNGGTKGLLAVFTSGSQIFLKELLANLKLKADIKDTGIRRHGSSKNTYQLRFSTRNSLRLFRLMYGNQLEPELCMQRKYAIFIEYLEAHGLSPADIPEILETKGPVVNRKHDALQKRYLRVRLPPGPPIMLSSPQEPG